MRRYCVEAIERRLAEEPAEYLTAAEAPVLAELWDNEDDAVYDDPEWQEGEREAEKTSGPAMSKNSPRRKT